MNGDFMIFLRDKLIEWTLDKSKLMPVQLRNREFALAHHDSTNCPEGLCLPIIFTGPQRRC